MMWQRRKSPRYPDLIVQVDSTQEIVSALAYARKRKLRVTTRCGGHSMAASFLRDRGMLIDVSRLSSLEIDANAREIVAGPAVIARELNAQLAPHGLAFSTAHCGMVPVGGFLLGGGLGLNGNAWGGMGSFNILSAEIVTATGEILTAGPEEHPDLYWAIRGGGPGLFGVVTKLRLKAYPLPAAIVGNTWTFRFRDIEDVVSALAEAAPRIDRDVELLAYVGPAGADLSANCQEDGCRLVIALDANAYTSSVEVAERKLRPLMTHSIMQRCIAKQLGQKSTIEQLYFNEELGFGQRRWVCDNVFTNRARDVASVLKARMLSCPAPEAQAVLLFKGRDPWPDAACSMRGDFYAAYYMMWDEPTQDPVMMGYLRDLYREIAPLGVGSNINEMDQEGRPADIKNCYTPEAWSRLAMLRSQWDPQGLFHDFYGRS